MKNQVESLTEEFIPITDIQASAYTFPTTETESDGTLEWNSTTIIIVRIFAGDRNGLGYTYNHHTTSSFINDYFPGILLNKNCLNINERNNDLYRSVRNIGRASIATCAISAVDSALWDLKAKLLRVPLTMLLGMVKNRTAIYGSGGFTSYSINQLSEQFRKWVKQGITAVKMKVGRDPEADIRRVKAARDVVGTGTDLFVDANGAYGIKLSLKQASYFKEQNVVWFEEPVSSDNLEGLNFIRTHIDPGIEIAAGEYGYDRYYFLRMLKQKAVDVLQADATRCGGISGFLSAGEITESFQVPLSAHTAPTLHLHPGCSLNSLRNIEYFIDHTRIEKIMFDGFPEQENGYIKPDLSRPGLGIELKENDVKKYRVR